MLFQNFWSPVATEVCRTFRRVPMNRRFGAQGLFAEDLFSPGFVQAYDEPHDVPRRAPITENAPRILTFRGAPQKRTRLVFTGPLGCAYILARPKDVRASSFTGPLGCAYPEAPPPNLKPTKCHFYDTSMAQMHRCGHGLPERADTLPETFRFRFRNTTLPLLGVVGS